MLSPADRGFMLLPAEGGFVLPLNLNSKFRGAKGKTSKTKVTAASVRH